MCVTCVYTHVCILCVCESLYYVCVCTLYVHQHICVCVHVFDGRCLATKFFIGKLLAMYEKYSLRGLNYFLRYAPKIIIRLDHAPLTKKSWQDLAVPPPPPRQKFLYETLCVFHVDYYNNKIMQESPFDLEHVKTPEPDVYWLPKFDLTFDDQQVLSGGRCRVIQ